MIQTRNVVICSSTHMFYEAHLIHSKGRDHFYHASRVLQYHLYLPSVAICTHTHTSHQINIDNAPITYASNAASRTSGRVHRISFMGVFDTSAAVL